MMSQLDSMSPCPCGNKSGFYTCCGPFLSGKALPKTPEELMRSRYSAFAVGNAEYLMATRHPSAQAPGERDSLLDSIRNTQWLGLKVLAAEPGPDENTGFVRFAAFYKADAPGQLHEHSRFIRENGQWFYVDGKILSPLAFSRNEPCWCGSQKKYKKCHGAP